MKEIKITKELSEYIADFIDNEPSIVGQFKKIFLGFALKIVKLLLKEGFLEVPKTYKYYMNNTMIEILMAVWRAVIDQGHYVIDINKSDINPRIRPSLTKAGKFGLISQQKDANGDKIPNKWLLTKLGSDFLHGRAGVREWVEVRKNHIVNRSENLVWKENFKEIREYKPPYEIIGNQLIKIDNKIIQMNLL